MSTQDRGPRIKGRVPARSVVTLILASMALACVDAPSAVSSAAQDAPLAVSFDVLSREQAQAGDAERSQELAWAALAVRTGVQPSRFEVNNAGVPEIYDAFVHSTHWAVALQAQRPNQHRTLVAWRKTTDRLQVLLLSSHQDQAPVVHPVSMGPPHAPMSGARAAYFVRGPNGEVWMGVSGNAKLAEGTLGGTCPPSVETSQKPTGVQCQLLKYTVGFDINFQKTRNTSARLPDPNGPTIRIRAGEQPINGAKLTFSCPTPESDRGCR